MSSHTPYASRPRTIQELADRAEQGIQWSDRYALKIWLKSALSLVRTAEQHERDGDLEGAFVLIARAATVILEKLPTHPEFQRSLTSIEKANLRHNGENYLNSLSRLKLLLLKRFDDWYKQHPEWTIELERELSKSGASSSGAASSSTNVHISTGTIDRPSSTPASTPARRDRSDSNKKNTVHWEAHEPRYTRDRSEDGSPGRSTIVPSSLIGRSDGREGRSTEMTRLEDDFGRMRTSTPPHDSYRGSEWYGGQESSAWSAVPPSYVNSHPRPSYAPISYPTLATGPRLSEPYVPSYPQYQDYRRPFQGIGIPPPLPPLPPPPQIQHLPISYPSTSTRSRSAPSFPPLPSGVGDYYGLKSGTPTPPSSNLTTTATTTTSKRSEPPPPPPRSGLRRLLIPSSILSTFLDIARPQTSRKIETCALLLGTSRERGSLDHEELVVEVLLVPKQKGGSDTCQMEEEEMVVEVQLERGLIALGWIHTHPTQSCFMSSMDLHTHSAYQQTLPEAVAIVCAPKSDPSYGIFRLTEPTGLSTIIKCKRSALFHEHPDVKGGIYTDADGGHVKLMSGGGVEVIDLRRK